MLEMADFCDSREGRMDSTRIAGTSTLASATIRSIAQAAQC